MSDKFIEDLKEKVKKATSKEESALEFEKAMSVSKDPPIMIALDVVEKNNGNIWEIFDANPISSVTKDFNGSVLGRIYNVTVKMFERNGKKHKMLTCFVKDKTGSLPMTIFDPPQLGDGDLVLMRNISGEEFNGKLRLRGNRNSEFEILKRGTSHGISKVNISQVNPDMKFIEVEGEVRIIERDRPVKGDSSRMTYGVIKDSTGTIPFRAWDVDIDEGIVKITGATPRVYNGKLYLNIGKNSKIETIKKQSSPRNLLELEQVGNGDLEGIGRIVSFIVRNPFIDVCSECGRVLRDGKCSNHPEAKAEKIIRVTAVLDDGTSSQYVNVYQRNLAELLGEDFIKKIINSLDSSDLKSKLNEFVLSDYKFKLTSYSSRATDSKNSNRVIMEMVEMNKISQDDMKQILEKIRGEIE